MAGGAVPGADVGLPEELGHVGLGDGAGHLGQPILQDLGQASQMLPAHGQGAQTLQDGGRQSPEIMDAWPQARQEIEGVLTTGDRTLFGSLEEETLANYTPG